ACNHALKRAALGPKAWLHACPAPGGRSAGFLRAQRGCQHGERQKSQGCRFQRRFASHRVILRQTCCDHDRMSVRTPGNKRQGSASIKRRFTTRQPIARDLRARGDQVCGVENSTVKARRAERGMKIEISPVASLPLQLARAREKFLSACGMSLPSSRTLAGLA